MPDFDVMAFFNWFKKQFKPASEKPPVSDEQLRHLLVREMLAKFPQDSLASNVIRAAVEFRRIKGLSTESGYTCLDKPEPPPVKPFEFGLAPMPIRGTIEIVEEHIEEVPGLGTFHFENGLAPMEITFERNIPSLHSESEVLPVSWRFSDADGQRWELKTRYCGLKFPEYVFQDSDDELPDHIKLDYHWWAKAPESMIEAFSIRGLARKIETSTESIYVDVPLQISGETMRFNWKHSWASCDLAWLPESNSVVIRLSGWYSSHDMGSDEVPPFYFTVPLGSLFPLTSTYNSLEDSYEDGEMTFDKLSELGIPQPNVRFIPGGDS